jgi:hypothetical protein
MIVGLFTPCFVMPTPATTYPTYHIQTNAIVSIVPQQVPICLLKVHSLPQDPFSGEN